MKRFLPAVAALLAILSSGLIQLPASIASADLPAESELVQCTNQSRALAVLFLVDASSSLKEEDEFAIRAVAINEAVQSLVAKLNSEQQEERQFSVYLEFVLFGTTTRRAFKDEWKPWQELQSGEVPESLRNAIFSLSSANEDSDTDYLGALGNSQGGAVGRPSQYEGALDIMDQAPSGACRLLVWFTDGRFDLDPPKYGEPPKSFPWSESQIRTEEQSKQVRDEGVRLLCAVNGPVDRLRSGSIVGGEGIEVAVIALGDPSRFKVIERVIEDPDRNCGSKPARGEIYPVSFYGDLIFSIQEAVNGKPVNGDTTSETCSRPFSSTANDKIECFISFNLAAGIGSFDLLVLKANETVSVELISPKLEVIEIGGSSTSSQTVGAQIVAEKFDNLPRAVSVHAELSALPSDWEGEWRVRYWAPDGELVNAINRTHLYVFKGSLQARLRNATQVLRRGSENSLLVEIVSETGDLVSIVESIGELKLDVFANGDKISGIERRSDGSWEIPLPIAESDNQDKVSLEAQVGALVAIDPSLPPLQIGQWSAIRLGNLEVRDQPKYPIINGGVSTFSNALSQVDKYAEANLVLVAPEDEGGGCVELVDVTNLASSNGERRANIALLLDGDVIEESSACPVEIGPGEERVLTIRVDATSGDFSQNDTLRGAVSLRSSSAINSDQFEVFTQEVVVESRPKIRSVLDYRRAFSLAFVAVLCSIVVLYLFGWFTAKLDLGRRAVLRLPVAFSNGQLFRGLAGELAAMDYRDEEVDFRELPQRPGKYRRILLKDAELKARMPRLPFSDCSGEARAIGSGFIFTAFGGSRGSKRAAINTSLTNSWYLSTLNRPTVNAGQLDPIDGTLTLLINPDLVAARNEFPRRVKEIESVLAENLARQAVHNPEDLVEDSTQPMESEIPAPIAEVPEISGPYSVEISSSGVVSEPKRKGFWPARRRKRQDPSVLPQSEATESDDPQGPY